MTAAPTVPPVVRQWAAVLAGLLDLSGGALDDDQPELWLAALRRWMDDPADRAGLRAATDAADHVVQAEINRHFLADRRAAFPRTLGPAETLRRLALDLLILAEKSAPGFGPPEVPPDARELWRPDPSGHAADPTSQWLSTPSRRAALDLAAALLGSRAEGNGWLRAVLDEADPARAPAPRPTPGAPSGVLSFLRGRR